MKRMKFTDEQNNVWEGEVPVRKNTTDEGECYFTSISRTVPKEDFEYVEVFELYEMCQKLANGIGYLQSKLNKMSKTTVSGIDRITLEALAELLQETQPARSGGDWADQDEHVYDLDSALKFLSINHPTKTK